MTLPKIKGFYTACCVFLSIAFSCDAIGDAKHENQANYPAERILEFLRLKTSCKSNIVEKNWENYLREILGCLESEEVFGTISTLLIENNSLINKGDLTQGERGLLLSLCLYQYCKNTPLYWPKVSEVVGLFPDLNVFFDVDAVNTSPQGDSGYATYQIAQDKVLVLQLVGRGAHNGSYLLWYVKVEDGKFRAVLLDIPRYIEDLEAFQTNAEFIARSCYYDFKNKYFVINVNTGDVNGWKEEENTYQIKGEKLILVQSCIYKKECKTLSPNVYDSEK